MAVVGDSGIAQGADENRVEAAEQVVAAGRDRDLRFEVVVGTPRQMLELEAPTESLRDRRQYLERFRRYVLADPVARDNRQLHLLTCSRARRATAVRPK